MELTAPEFTAALAERGYTPGIDLRLRYGHTRGLLGITADIGFYDERGYHNYHEIEDMFGITCADLARLSYAWKTFALFDRQLRELDSGVVPDFTPQKEAFFTEWRAAFEKVGFDWNNIPVSRERHTR